MYYITKIKYNKVKEGGESGETIPVRENYLISALSVTDAETKIIKWTPSNFKGLEVQSVSLLNLKELITRDSSETYFLAKVGEFVETKAAEPKLRMFQVMVNGKDIHETLKGLKDYYEKSINDFVIDGISLCRIIVDNTLTS